MGRLSRSETGWPRRSTRRSSQLVLGLDPILTALWPAAVSAAGDSGTPAERAGGRGARATASCSSTPRARPASPSSRRSPSSSASAPPAGRRWRRPSSTRGPPGLLVLADVKRGDVPHVAGVYAQGLVSRPRARSGTSRASAPTPSPSTRSWARDVARRARAGQPARGRRDLRARAHLQPGRGRRRGPRAAPAASPLWERLAEIVDRLGASGLGESGLADVGAVTGATVPEHLARMRELMPRTAVPAPRRRCAGRRGRVARARLRARAGPAGSSAPRAASPTRTRPPTATPPRRRRPRRPRPSACARSPGRWAR